MNRWIQCMIVAALTVGALAAQEMRTQGGFSPAQKAAMTTGDEYIAAAQKSRVAKRFSQAENQCRAAIQVLQQNGFPANGETALLGMILYESGAKREGFKVLRDSYQRVGVNVERDIYLGRIGLGLGQYAIAAGIVGHYRKGGRSVGSAAISSRADWPKGNSANALQATLELIAGSRLVDNIPVPKEGLDLLRHANRIYPGNPAINFALGMKLLDSSPKEAVACLKIAATATSDVPKKVAKQWYMRLTT